ncbi:dioxygenase [Pycnococcus provasolii]
MVTILLYFYRDYSTRHLRRMLDEVALEASLRSSGSNFGLAAASAASAASSNPEDVCVPVIDLQSLQAADLLWQAASTLGFFVVTNHGVPQKCIDDAFNTSDDFFLNHTLEQKEAQSPFSAPNNAGYEFMKQVRPSTGLPDQKESLQVTARQGCMDGRWPNAPANLKPAVEALLEHSHALCSRLLNMLEPRAAPQLKPGTLANAHTLWADDGQCTLRMLHYPPIEGGKDKLAKLAEDGHWRAGPHTDWCNLTLLYQRAGESGLECAPNVRAAADTAWVAVDNVDGGIAVNVGDMLGRWSDGRLYSNLHRVRMPKPEEAHKGRRSVAFFMQADKKALIECSQHDAITAGDYILGRIKSNFDASKS